ncbi:hypothetical protein HYH02_010231 [Chlamydomonas schloesseri]|uniref:Phosphatidic acid phosphatase type 2/haloperoxidase domain-containing protein n=1 Tax=Chlamydomonas schloesseri TaxID=2026947 RepID=A0A835W4V0_9CHLO|nr:hypothetical protein HYH02_010231 [Chlamydomonas schloesseri]|eukprot:KAG2440652.1 hypothetical protein HYH02_010231 [Chlamydomonas schloesseri]
MVSWNSVGHFFVYEGYLWDWLAAAAAIVINLVVPAQIDPLNRYYSPKDPTLSYPAADSSVPSSALYVLVFALPAVVFAVAACFKRWAAPSWAFVDWHHAALSIAEGFAFTTGFKRWINLVGCYRPNWLATLAAADQTEIDDARLSYPSGHSAYMFFSMTILSLYLVGKTELLHRPSQLLFLKSICVIAPMALAAFVAVSRIADYKHAPCDVNAGCFIGFVCGVFCYFLNYPSLFDPASALPKRRGSAAAKAAVERAAEEAEYGSVPGAPGGGASGVYGTPLQPRAMETPEQLAIMYGASSGGGAVSRSGGGATASGRY